MKSIIPYLKNVRGSIKSTIMGAILVAFGGYLIVTTEGSLNMVMDTAIISAGLVLFFLEDQKMGLTKKEDK